MTLRGMSKNERVPYVQARPIQQGARLEVFGEKLNLAYHFELAFALLFSGEQSIASPGAARMPEAGGANEVRTRSRVQFSVTSSECALGL